jgi:uncharacterized protein YktB (UPF0637 family)
MLELYLNVLTQFHDTGDRILAQHGHVMAASLPLIAEHKRKTLDCCKKNWVAASNVTFRL